MVAATPAANWEREIGTVMTKLSFVQGVSNSMFVASP